jgi:hypothetical protein
MIKSGAKIAVRAAPLANAAKNASSTSGRGFIPIKVVEP